MSGRLGLRHWECEWGAMVLEFSGFTKVQVLLQQILEGMLLEAGCEGTRFF
jgi:hypothetical protein